LAARARAGRLTSAEQAEVEASSRVSSLLDSLKSKARRALQRRGTQGKAKAQWSTQERALEELTWERAGQDCEYCRMPQAYDDETFEIDHVIALPDRLEQLLGVGLARFRLGMDH
jgi:hypothetical protein